MAIFSGHQNSTFYIKSSLSPDDQFLVSGSSDEAAYIWQVSCQFLVAKPSVQGEHVAGALAAPDASRTRLLASRLLGAHAGHGTDNPGTTVSEIVGK